MADINLADVFEPYVRDGRIHFRRRHDIHRSLRAKEFRACVGDRLRGHAYRTGNPSEDERAVRAALTAAARTCAKQV